MSHDMLHVKSARCVARDSSQRSEGVVKSRFAPFSLSIISLLLTTILHSFFFFLQQAFIQTETRGLVPGLAKGCLRLYNLFFSSARDRINQAWTCLHQHAQHSYSTPVGGCGESLSIGWVRKGSEEREREREREREGGGGGREGEREREREREIE